MMIQNMAKKGQFKKEELEWSGLIEWLNEQEGKVTKNQIIDYLNKSQTHFTSS